MGMPSTSRDVLFGQSLTPRVLDLGGVVEDKASFAVQRSFNTCARDHSSIFVLHFGYFSCNRDLRVESLLVLAGSSCYVFAKWKSRRDEICASCERTKKLSR